MDKKTLRELREAQLAFNDDGDFVFVLKKQGKTNVYGPYNFGDAMRICWQIGDDFKEELRRKEQ